MTMWAIIKTSFEGFHAWKDAPEEVSFLRSRHRHMFHVEVWIQQYDGDREVEFIQLKRNVKKIVEDIKDKDWSCEQFAKEIALKARDKYRITVEGKGTKAVIQAMSRAYFRNCKVFVSEDKENGCCFELGSHDSIDNGGCDVDKG